MTTIDPMKRLLRARMAYTNVLAAIVTAETVATLYVARTRAHAELLAAVDAVLAEEP